MTSWEKEAARVVMILFLTPGMPPATAAFSAFRILWTAERIIFFWAPSARGLVISISLSVFHAPRFLEVRPAGVSFTGAFFSSPSWTVVMPTRVEMPLACSSSSSSSPLDTSLLSFTSLTPGPSPALVSCVASSLDTCRTWPSVPAAAMGV